MDISDTISVRSDQLNAEDLLTGPMTVTVESVSRGTAEQPVNIKLEELPGKAFRPSKAMRRVMVQAWGKDAQQYIGRRLTLFREPSVIYAGQPVGGIRISHMSHLDGPLKVAIRLNRTQREPFTVQPLVEAAPSSVVTAEMVAACTDADQLRDWWTIVGPDLQTLIQDRAKEITQ